MADNNNRKIVYVSNSRIPSKTANSIHVMKMANAIAGEPGIQLTLLAPAFNDTLKLKDKSAHEFYDCENNFNIVYLPIFGYPRLMRVLVYSIFSAVYVLVSRPLLVFSRSELTACLTSILGIPTILETHTPEPLDRFSRMLFPYVLRKKSLLGVIVITGSLRRLLVEKYPLFDLKGSVFSDAVDFKGFIDIEPPKLGSKDLNIGYAGHLYEGRGIDVILELAIRFKDYKFHVWGGYDKDLELWRTRASGVSNIFFYGYIPHYRLKECYRKSDILLLPYQKRVAVFGNSGNTVEWMSPLKLFEYMAAGRPIIASDLPVLREVLSHKENALLVEPESVDDWADALRQLTGDIDLSLRLGSNARTEAEKKYTWEKRWQGIKAVHKVNDLLLG